MKYRDGLGLVDAVQWNGWCVDEVRELCGEYVGLAGEYEMPLSAEETRACWKYVIVPSVFGQAKAAVGDYIIKRGARIFVMSPATFLQFYTAA